MGEAPKCLVFNGRSPKMLVFSQTHTSRHLCAGGGRARTRSGASARATGATSRGCPTGCSTQSCPTPRCRTCCPVPDHVYCQTSRTGLGRAWYMGLFSALHVPGKKEKREAGVEVSLCHKTSGTHCWYTAGPSASNTRQICIKENSHYSLGYCVCPCYRYEPDLHGPQEGQTMKPDSARGILVHTFSP